MAGKRRIGPLLLGAVLIAAAAAAVAARLVWGLGATTNLSDRFPWGLWIGFDVLIGVATSAGGFTVAFLVYILGRESYRGIARAAVLTAFLGYALVGTALLLDIGRPMRLWHPMIYWNPHSVMFEVSWCVMLYTTVLAAEFSPEVFGFLSKATGLQGLRRLGERIHRAMPLLAGAGVLLSTLHQSSLGTVYLIVPAKMHAYWYTPLLPVVFFATAVKCGLGMTILEASFSHAGLGAAYEAEPLERIGRWLRSLLVVTLVLQVGDLWVRDVDLSTASYERGLLALEVLLGGALPLALLAASRRWSPPRLLAAAVLSVLGVVLHRMNVSITSLEGWAGGRYVPSVAEVAVTLGFIAGGVAAFAVASRVFGITEPDYRRPVPLLDGLSGVALAGAVAALAVAVAVHPGPAAAVAPPLPAPPDADAGHHGPELLLGETLPARFPHAAHRNGCPTCHADSSPILPIFAASGPRRGRGLGGHGPDGCGSCHDGRRAFGIEAACDRCHMPFSHSGPDIEDCGDCHAKAPRPGQARAVFTHRMHAARADTCRTCHADGRDRPPWEDVRMEDLYLGRACARCHDGATAFSVAACGGCHGE